MSSIVHMCGNVSDVWIRMLVLSDLKTDARKGHFWNGCMQGSFWAPMHATRKAIVTDARNGLLAVKKTTSQNVWPPINSNWWIN